MPRDENVDLNETRRRIVFMWNALQRYDRRVELLERKAGILMLFEVLSFALPGLLLIKAIAAGGHWGGRPLWGVSVGGALALVVLTVTICLLLLRALLASRSNLYPPDSAGVLRLDLDRYDRKEFLESTWMLGASQQWAELEGSTLIARELLRRKHRAYRCAVFLIAAQLIVLLAATIALVVAV